MLQSFCRSWSFFLKCFVLSHTTPKRSVLNPIGTSITGLPVLVWHPIYHIPSSYIPIIPLTIRREKKCCTVTTIPLRVYKALSIYKLQGISVGPGNSFDSAVICLPEKGERTDPEPELVTTSRVTNISFLAMCDINR